MRETQPVTREERQRHGDASVVERHPAFGMIRAARVSGSAHLYDSDLVHQHYVTVEIHTGWRERMLNRDWKYSGQQIVEVAMSEAQWASFVSSMNTSGVACTLQWDQNGPIPGLEPEQRMAESTREVVDAAEKAFARIKAAMAAVDALPANAGAKAKREAMEDLRRAIGQTSGNIKFATDSLTEFTEDTVQRARADVEAMVAAAAHQHALGAEVTRRVQAAIASGPAAEVEA